jgi:hypothetical protein
MPAPASFGETASVARSQEADDLGGQGCGRERMTEVAQQHFDVLDKELLALVFD